MTRADQRVERHELSVQRRAWRKERRQEQAARLTHIGRTLRPVAPLALVTGLAMYGQVSYAFASIVPQSWSLPFRLLLAVGVAVAVESIALYVQWHAHDALLNSHTLTAARQRRASYAIAGGVAAVNYSHFAGSNWAVTPAAVCFAGFSAAGPWLWGLHTRRAQRVQLSREGHLDIGGAVFSAERWRWFPRRTFQAMRWSIDHGVTDPRAAWVGYNAEQGGDRLTSDDELTDRPPDRVVERSRADDDQPDVRQVDEAIIASLIDLHRSGEPLPSMTRLRGEKSMGIGRANRLLNTAADRIGRPLKELQETKS